MKKNINYSENRKERIRERNNKVRAYFDKLEKENPNWCNNALLQKTAEQFPPITVNTVTAIIKRNGIYKD